MVDIYHKYFTIEESDDFTNFYKSKSGQKMITQMPDITRDVMAIMTAKYQTNFQRSVMEDIEELTNEMSEQMKTKQN